MDIAVVIPAYNEEKMIGQVIKDVRTACPHVFVVDDGSSDGTAASAHAAGANVLRHVLNRGQGAALATGIEAALKAGADIVVTFDADGQMDPADIASLVAPIEAGICDVALGSRFHGNGCHPEPVEGRQSRMPFVRRLTLKAALVFTKLTTGLALTDTHNGLRAFSRAAAAELEIKCDRMAHASEILEEISRHGWRYREIPVKIRYTEYSMKKGQKISGAFRILRDLIMSSWTK
jgi:polyprenyl-phospho-N-acetylgalactosaminyl synthase